MSAQGGSTKRVLVVDDDRENIDILTQFLAQEGHSVQSAQDGESALHRIRAWKPHLILLDVNLPKISGLELISKVRAITPDDYVSIILVSASITLEHVTRGHDAGADDYLTKPFRAQELISRVRTMLRLKETQDALRRASHRIDELSSTDELTGQLNIRTLYRKGEEEIVRARRFRKPVSALLVNLDGFSKVNHDYGFLFGSQVLDETGKRIRSCLRSIDFVARVGADEFFVLLVETDLAGAEFMAERIRDAIKSNPYKGDRKNLELTCSIGVAGIMPDAPEQKMSDLLHAAHEALRSAKSAGPNTVEVYSFA